MERLYPIRAVAKITGLSVDTLRAWERRYKAVTPSHAARGRQYTDADIHRLILLRDAVRRGHSIGLVAGKPNEELSGLLEKRTFAHENVPGGPPDLLAPILDALERYDHIQVEDELGRLAAFLAPRELIFRVVLPLMHEVGARWQVGTLSIAQEHLASCQLRHLLGSLIRLHFPRVSSTKMLVGTPSGELHEFGALAAAMLASISGITPIYLGPNLPAEEYRRAAEKTGASVVTLGLSGGYNEGATEARRVADLLPESVEVWAGGYLAGAGVIPDLGPRVVTLRDLGEFETRCLLFAQRSSAG